MYTRTRCFEGCRSRFHALSHWRLHSFVKWCFWYFSAQKNSLASRRCFLSTDQCSHLDSTAYNFRRVKKEEKRFVIWTFPLKGLYGPPQSPWLVDEVIFKLCFLVQDFGEVPSSLATWRSLVWFWKIVNLDERYPLDHLIYGTYGSMQKAYTLSDYLICKHAIVVYLNISTSVLEPSFNISIKF